MREFTSIFHEENIPIPKYNSQDAKMNMNISVSQKNYPKMKQIVDSEQRNDAKNAANAAKKQIETQKHVAATNIKESTLIGSIKLI